VKVTNQDVFLQTVRIQESREVSFIGDKSTKLDYCAIPLYPVRSIPFPLKMPISVLLQDSVHNGVVAKKGFRLICS
jgi:hypothetical protein